MTKVLIAMSGGVDSSAAAALCLQQGFSCAGATMKLYENEEIGVHSRTCCSLSDIEDARAVCARLHIPYYVFNFTREFRRDVMEPFTACYRQGSTPNPCIECNRHLKFDRLFRRAQVLGYDYLCTGHYARIEQDTSTGRWLLKKARDEKKDQSYVLYGMTQEQLSHTLFPLGDLCKEETRALAARLSLSTAQKQDSQDLCFVPDGDYAAFLQRFTGETPTPGPIVTLWGETLGQHQGLYRYTIGQRRGIGIPYPEPLYVVWKDLANNRLVLGRNQDLFSRRFWVEKPNLIAFSSLSQPIRCTARVRYHQQEEPLLLTPLPDGSWQGEFLTPQRAITRGQAAVFYDGDRVIGGGEISRTELDSALEKAT